MKKHYLFLSLLVAVLTISGCGNARSVSSQPRAASSSSRSSSSKKTNYTQVPDMPETYANENLNKIANYISQTHETNPEYYKETDPSIRGTVSKIDYKTRAYAYEKYFNIDLGIIDKYFYIYTPHGYDPNDKETKYSTLFLIHGGSEETEYWFRMETEKDDQGPVGEGFVVRLLDNMIAQKVIEPLIVVAPALYVDVGEYHAYDRGGLDRRHGDNKTKNDPSKVCTSVQTAWTDEFNKEIRNDILPIIDGQYNTYANREHRGIGGTSMGSITTLRSGLWLGNDLFSWYAPMSAGFIAGNKEEELFKATDDIWNDITENKTKDPEINMILNFCGTLDMAHEGHINCMNHLLKYAAPDTLTNGDNYAFFDIEGFDHNFDAWKYDLSLILQVFFK